MFSDNFVCYFDKEMEKNVKYLFKNFFNDDG